VLIEADPISTVYIDGQEVGKTPYEANRKPEEITLRIKPDNINNIVLDDYETKINLVSGIRTIVKRVFRETEEASSGVVVSFEKLGGKESYVTVVSVPDNAQVLIDSKIYGYTPLRVKVPAGDHNLVVSADKYLEKSLPIRVYAGYKLTASVKLAKIVEEIKTKIKILPTIVINKTDVGFLRVREGAGLNFPEVAQVKPDEEYEVIEENEDGSWFKIKTGEVEGWISAEFVTKIYIPLTDTPE
ncbi:MAG: PEGA domain-containing protein, partial [Candidatus Woesebacteria bacterium]|nr:PEGA domain-containing protein [Candidatus Woesebacteria bacterium]